MKLVHVITGTGVGGAEVMLDTLLRALTDEFECRVISLAAIGAIGERIRARGIPVESVDMRPGVPGPIALMRLVTRLRRLKPDLVHTWMYHADLVGGVAARLARVPAVIWALHNSDLPRDRVKSSTRLVVKACAALSRRIPDRIVCCSEAAREIHLAYGYPADRFLVVPNGLEVHRFKPDAQARREIREALRIPGQAPVVGLIARWDPQKNQEGFLEAAALLRLRRPDARFVMAGTGVDDFNAALGAVVDRYGLKESVRLLGRRDDVPRLMASFDLLASSSVYGEAFPLVLCEAMASGVPCVTTDVGDSASIVAETGAVVPVGDTPALAAAMEAMLARGPHALLELGRRARDRVVANFEIGHIARRYESVYRSVSEPS